MINVNDLIGKPFLMNGLGPIAYDCWGLMRECFRRKGVEIPLLPCTEGWVKLEEAEPDCAVLFSVEGRLEHVGYMLDEGKFIHVMENKSVIITPINHLFWRTRLEGFYQWVGANHATP